MKIGVPRERRVAEYRAGLAPAGAATHDGRIVDAARFAALFGKTIRQRVRALIDIAAPEFRAGLERQAQGLRYL